MEFKQIINYVFKRFLNGIQYKKVGKNISQENNKQIDGLYVGAKIEYNARSAFHSI